MGVQNHDDAAFVVPRWLGRATVLACGGTLLGLASWGGGQALSSLAARDAVLAQISRDVAVISRDVAVMGERMAALDTRLRRIEQVVDRP